MLQNIVVLHLCSNDAIWLAKQRWFKEQARYIKKINHKMADGAEGQATESPNFYIALL